MYVLIGVFLSVAYVNGVGVVSQQAASLGEFNSLAACQSAAAATKIEADRWGKADTNLRFVCAKK